MKIGYTNQTGEFDGEILRSSDFQLISVTLDATATYDPDGSSSTTKIPKGCLLTKDTDLTDGTYTVLSTASGELNGTPTQYMKDAVVLAETIVDASLGDQPVKAYIAGTFDYAKITYSNYDNTKITLAQWQDAAKIKVVDLAQTS